MWRGAHDDQLAFGRVKRSVNRCRPWHRHTPTPPAAARADRCRRRRARPGPRNRTLRTTPAASPHPQGRTRTNTEATPPPEGCTRRRERIITALIRAKSGKIADWPIIGLAVQRTKSRSMRPHSNGVPIVDQYKVCLASCASNAGRPGRSLRCGSRPAAAAKTAPAHSTDQEASGAIYQKRSRCAGLLPTASVPPSAVARRRRTR